MALVLKRAADGDERLCARARRRRRSAGLRHRQPHYSVYAAEGDHFRPRHGDQRSFHRAAAQDRRRSRCPRASQTFPTLSFANGTRKIWVRGAAAMTLRDLYGAPWGTTGPASMRERGHAADRRIVMQPVGIGVIGCGNISSAYLKAATKVPDPQRSLRSPTSIPRPRKPAGRNLVFRRVRLTRCLPTRLSRSS